MYGSSKTWSTKFSENYFGPIDFSAEIVIFSFQDKAGNSFTTIFDDLDGSFKITSCDETNHKMSGTFNFNIYDEDQNETTFSNGKFDNICFEVN